MKNNQSKNNYSTTIKQFKSYLDEDDFQYIRKAFENNFIAEGEISKEFHDRLLSIIGAKYGCFASNGTLALYLALKALGVKTGDEVLVQDVTFIASANAVEMVGAKPVFIDVIKYNNLTIDLSKIELKNNTKAIVLCHLFGTACENIEEVKAYCNKNGLLLIEDAAQALAIKSDSGHCGTFGDVGTFSFFADKTITTGEGGFVVTDNEEVYQKMLYLRNQGRVKSGTFIHEHIGYNFRITDIQACLGLSQLSKLDKITSDKLRIYETYKKYLGGSVEFLKIDERFSYIPFRVVIFVKNAEKMINIMQEKGIEPRSMFYPLHKQPCYISEQTNESNFSNSNECFDKGICLPTWVGLKEEDIQYISLIIKDVLQEVQSSN